jgi:hypothetical protein
MFQYQRVISSATAAANIATVKGTGTPGQTLIMTCNGVDCGSVKIGSDGKFKF